MKNNKLNESENIKMRDIEGYIFPFLYITCIRSQQLLHIHKT